MIILVLARDEQGAIGKGNGLPWGRIPQDMKFFRHLTTGASVLMGRKTFETLGKPLPNRENIVVSRDKFYSLSWNTEHDTQIVSTPEPESVLTLNEKVKPERNLFVIGGAEIYTLALPFAHRAYVTEVPGVHDADVFWNHAFDGWSVVRRKIVDGNRLVCTIAIYDRPDVSEDIFKQGNAEDLRVLSLLTN